MRRIEQIDAAKEMPLGPSRNAKWAAIDAAAMKTNAPWVPFMNRQIPKFVSARVHGLVFNITYYELLPSMWLTK